MGARLGIERMAWGLFAVAALISIALIGLEGRGILIHGDEWGYFHRLSVDPLPIALLDPPTNQYLIAVPLLAVFAPLGELFGIGEYLPIRLAGIALVVLAAALLFELVRRRAGPAFALPAAILLLFLGAAWEVVVIPSRIPGLIAACAGLGLLLALDRDDRRGDRIASALGVVGIASHPFALAFLAGAGVRVGFGGRQAVRRLALVVGVPVAVLGAWRVAVYEQETIFPLTLSGVVEFVGEHLVSLAAALTGAFRGPWAEAGDFINPAAVVVAIATGFVLALVVLRRGGLTVGLAAGLAALAVTAIAPAIGPSAGLGLNLPFAGRYLHPGAVVVLWVVSEMIAAGRPWPRWIHRAAGFAAVAWLAIALIPNVAELRDRSAEQVREADVLRVQLRALEIAREVEGSLAARRVAEEGGDESVAALGFYSGQVGPEGAGQIAAGAAAYFDVAVDYGTPAMATEDLLRTPPVYRQQADLVLGFALPLRAIPAASPPNGRADDAKQARTDPSDDVAPGTCSVVERSPASLPAQPLPAPEGSQPPLAMVTAPPGGGVWMHTEDSEGVALRVGHFADEPSYPVTIAGEGSEIALPDAGSEGLTWKLLLYAERQITLCAW